LLENLTVERKLYNGVEKFKPEKVGNFMPGMTNLIFIKTEVKISSVRGEF
jgi:hypothetical protein